MIRVCFSVAYLHTCIHAYMLTYIFQNERNMNKAKEKNEHRNEMKSYMKNERKKH